MVVLQQNFTDGNITPKRIFSRGAGRNREFFYSGIYFLFTSGIQSGLINSVFTRISVGSNPGSFSS